MRHDFQQHILVHAGARLYGNHAKVPVSKRPGLGESDGACVGKDVHCRAVLAEYSASGSPRYRGEANQRHCDNERAGIGHYKEHSGTAYRLRHADALYSKRQQRGNKDGYYTNDRRKVVRRFFKGLGVNRTRDRRVRDTLIEQRRRGILACAGDLTYKLISDI